MIDIITFNGSSVMLDSRLHEYERIAVGANFIIYNQFLNQLHLPSEKWSYDKENKGLALVEKHPELYILDAVLFKEFEYSKVVMPLQLYKYYLLQEFLGNGLNFEGLGIINEKKTRISYLNTDFSLRNWGNDQFQMNDLSRFIIKKAKKEELINAHETFFVLIDDKLKIKLLNALTFYQAETGLKVGKIELVDRLFDTERLAKLKAFSRNLIERK